MTYAQMKDYFLILQDKFGSPYLTDDEIALLLNRAQLDYVVSFLPVDDTLNVELNANSIARLQPLLFTQVSAAMDNNGWVFKAALETLIGHDIIRILSISSDNKPVSSTRWNNWYKYLNNVFKKGTNDARRVLVVNDRWIFNPVSTTAVLNFSGVRYPIEMLFDGSVDCELPDFTHNEIVARALSFAGVSSRDQMLSELKKLNSV